MSDEKELDNEQDERTTAAGLWVHAVSYLRAAEQVSKMNCDSHAPLYFLYSNAIELALKAYLRAKGASLSELQDMGHKLPSLLARARAAGLIEGKQEPANAAVLERLEPYGRNDESRYIVTGFKTLPPEEALQSVAANLVAAARAICIASLTQE
jgi:hypothetical protein